jgi:predicted transposase YdaD
VEETGPGIYTVIGDYLPIQIIETKRLSEEENLWLKSLTNDLERGAARAILEGRKDAPREVPLSAYMDVLLRANPEAFMEAWNMANSTRTFEEVFTEAGIIPQWIEQGEEKKALAIARNLLAKGWTVQDVAETTDLSLEKVRSLVIDS